MGRRLTDSGEGETKTKAFMRLRKSGGTSQFGWIWPWLLCAVFASPLYTTQQAKSAAATGSASSTNDRIASGARQPVAQQDESTPPLDPYISYVKSLSKRDRIYQSVTDMGIKFPKMNGYLSQIKGDFRPSYPGQASLIEQTQTWGFNLNHGRQGGFIVFQNRTNQPLKGITVEIQVAEGSCANKGMAYYMMLEFDRPVPAASVVGIDFQFPNAIQNSNRCLDVVDLIYN